MPSRHPYREPYRRPSVLRVVQVFAVLVALGAATTAAAENAEAADAPPAIPRILWLESGAGSCGPIFDEPAAPLELAPAPYPENARLAGLESSIRVRAVIDATGAVATAAARYKFPELAEAAEQAMIASTFRPAVMGGVAVSSAIEAVYDFRLRPGENRLVDDWPADDELENRAGLELQAPVRAFLEAADSIAIFKMCRDCGLPTGRPEPCPGRDLDLKTCGGRHFIRHPVSEPVPLSADQVARVKDLLLARSPYWMPAHEDRDLQSACVIPNPEYGLSLRSGGQEMFVLFSLGCSGTILFRDTEACYGSGHPYRRSTELFCALLEEKAGWGCVGDEWPR